MFIFQAVKFAKINIRKYFAQIIIMSYPMYLTMIVLSCIYVPCGTLVETFLDLNSKPLIEKYCVLLDR